MSILVAPALPYSPGSVTAESTAGSGNFGFSGQTMINRNKPIPNNSVVYSIGLCSNAAVTQKMKLVRRVSSGVYDILLDLPITHPGGSVFVDVVLPVPFPVPAAGDYFVGTYYTSFNLGTGNGPSRAYKTGDITGLGNTGFTEDSVNAPIIEFTVGL